MGTGGVVGVGGRVEVETSAMVEVGMSVCLGGISEYGAGEGGGGKGR